MPLSSFQTKLILGGAVAVIVIGFIFTALAGFAGRMVVNKMVEKSVEDNLGKNADVNTNADGTVEVTTDEGTMSTGKKVPSDWPDDVPVYAGATVQYSASVNPTDGKKGIALILMTSDKASVVAGYYEQELKAQGWTVSETMEGGGTSIVIATKDNRTASLMTNETQGVTTISLGVETDTE